MKTIVFTKKESGQYSKYTSYRKSDDDLLSVYLLEEKPETELISEGWILDFYKKAQKEEGLREDKFGYYYTKYGDIINKIKYWEGCYVLDSNCKLSAIENLEQTKIILKDILNNFYKIIKDKKLADDTLITYIPSKSNLPDCIARTIAKKLNLPLEKLIDVNRGIDESKDREQKIDLDFAAKKYRVSRPDDEKKRCMIFDDIFGIGSSLHYITRALKNYFEAVYFLCICKDLKR